MIAKTIFTLAVGILLNLSNATEPAKAKVDMQVQKESQAASQGEAVAKDIAPKKAATKCNAHKAAKKDCFICDSSLREKGRLWCKEHSRYEDRCFLCHPELKDSKRLWCQEHNLYEDECFLCHPELKDKDTTRKAP